MLYQSILDFMWRRNNHEIKHTTIHDRQANNNIEENPSYLSVLDLRDGRILDSDSEGSEDVNIYHVLRCKAGNASADDRS